MVVPVLPQHQISVIGWDPPLERDPAFDPSQWRPAAYVDRLAEPVGLHTPLLPANMPTQMSFEVTPDALPGDQLQVAVTAAYVGWPEGLYVRDSYWWTVPGERPFKINRDENGTPTGIEYIGGYSSGGGVTPPGASSTPVRLPTPTAGAEGQRPR